MIYNVFVGTLNLAQSISHPTVQTMQLAHVIHHYEIK